MRLFLGFKKSRVLYCAAAIPALFFCAIWGAGSLLSHPVNHSVGALPGHLVGREVEFESSSGSKLRGWLIPGRNGAGAVILMHGFRADRRELLRGATLLNMDGDKVVLLEF